MGRSVPPETYSVCLTHANIKTDKQNDRQIDRQMGRKSRFNDFFHANKNSIVLRACDLRGRNRHAGSHSPSSLAQIWMSVERNLFIYIPRNFANARYWKIMIGPGNAKNLQEVSPSSMSSRCSLSFNVSGLGVKKKSITVEKT